MIRVMALLILFVCLPSIAATYIPINIDRLVYSSQLVVKATVVTKASIQKCVGKNCEDGYLYELDATTALKGQMKGMFFCSTYSFEPETEYLLFLRSFDGYLTGNEKQVDRECNWVSTFNERDVFRFSIVSNKPVIDIANPPSVIFPKEITYYDARSTKSQDDDLYFSADWQELKEYIVSHLSKP